MQSRMICWLCIQVCFYLNANLRDFTWGESLLSIGMECATTCRSSQYCICTVGQQCICPIGSRIDFPLNTTASVYSMTQPDALRHVGPFENRKDAPQVSAPERALLEMLSEVGVRQPLQEARELIESTYNLRADILRDLLCHCTSVKTVRYACNLVRNFHYPGCPSWIRRNCLPEVIGPGSLDLPKACWYLNLEPNLSRYRTPTNSNSSLCLCRWNVCSQGRHRDQPVCPRHAAALSRSRFGFSDYNLPRAPGRFNGSMKSVRESARRLTNEVFRRMRSPQQIVGRRSFW